MTDLELYKKLSKRDYTESEADKYAQWLQTLFYHLPKNDFFNLLKLSIKQGKKINIKDYNVDEINIDNLFLE